MISLLIGSKGTGKTKRIIKLANEELKKAKGNIIFVDDDKRHMYDLKHKLRFISMDEYPVKNEDEFFGFLCGIISNDYDINKIFIDGLLKVMDTTLDAMPKLIEKLSAMSTKYEIDFFMTISCTKDQIHEDLHKYLVQV
ncbi:twitching motility protein PilT [Wukongibacter sp. M2B1]|uniref:twitching motility protein PilT n=1 Tax=Wukongibacter sp. M2B1 TaxID=3088895 RepID=UPI003D78CE3B